MINFIFVGIIKDIKTAYVRNILARELKSILMFRFAQYYGAYIGNKNHRKLSQSMKYKYFYPRISDMDVSERIEYIDKRAKK